MIEKRAEQGTEDKSTIFRIWGDEEEPAKPTEKLQPIK